MLKFSAVRENGVRVLGIGLSEENIRRMNRGVPIQFYVSEVGILLPFPVEVFIFTGKDEQTMHQQLLEKTREFKNGQIDAVEGD